MNQQDTQNQSTKEIDSHESLNRREPPSPSGASMGATRCARKDARARSLRLRMSVVVRHHPRENRRCFARVGDAWVAGSGMLALLLAAGLPSAGALAFSPWVCPPPPCCAADAFG